MQPCSGIRKLLQEATAPAHQRLHNHAGLAAVASGTINKHDYICLLKRLYGFHRSFDEMLCAAGPAFQTGLDLRIRQRAFHIGQDLATLGVDKLTLANLPLCDAITPPVSCAELLGALYVVEGSTLGGRVLARALSSLLGPDGMDGRRFFFGYGEEHATMWRDVVMQIEANANTPARQIEIVKGATRAFRDFEMWMKDWRAVVLSPGHQFHDRMDEQTIR